MTSAIVVAKALLRYFTPEEQEYPNTTPEFADRIDVVLQAINGAFQEITSITGKAWQRKVRRGYVFDAPVAVAVQVTRGSRVADITTVESAGDNLSGRLLAIEGNDARIEWQSGKTDNTYSVTLTDEWRGTTGTKTATLYGDARMLENDVLQVCDQVELDERYDLPLVNSERQALHRCRVAAHQYDYGFVPSQNRSTTPVPWNGLAGEPVACIAEIVQDDGGFTSPGRMILTVYPPPATGPNVIRTTVALKGFRVLPTDDLNTLQLPVPHDYAETILIPIAAQRLIASPMFRNDSVRDEISRQYEVAISSLRSLAPRRKNPWNFKPRL